MSNHMSIYMVWRTMWNIILLWYQENGSANYADMWRNQNWFTYNFTITNIIFATVQWNKISIFSFLGFSVWIAKIVFLSQKKALNYNCILCKKTREKYNCTFKKYDINSLFRKCWETMMVQTMPISREIVTDTHMISQLKTLSSNCTKTQNVHFSFF